MSSAGGPPAHRQDLDRRDGQAEEGGGLPSRPTKDEAPPTRPAMQARVGAGVRDAEPPPAALRQARFHKHEIPSSQPSWKQGKGANCPWLRGQSTKAGAWRSILTGSQALAGADQVG